MKRLACLNPISIQRMYATLETEPIPPEAGMHCSILENSNYLPKKKKEILKPGKKTKLKLNLGQSSVLSELTLKAKKKQKQK